MGSLRLSTAVVAAAVFVCLSILLQSPTVESRILPPPINLCTFPYGICSSSDPSGETCKDRCLKATIGTFHDGKCIGFTDPGTCMCCTGVGV